MPELPPELDIRCSLDSATTAAESRRFVVSPKSGGERREERAETKAEAAEDSRRTEKLQRVEEAAETKTETKTETTYPQELGCTQYPVTHTSCGAHLTVRICFAGRPLLCS